MHLYLIKLFANKSSSVFQKFVMVKVLFSVDLASEKLPPFWSLLQLIRAVSSPYLVGPPLSTKFTCFFYPCSSDTENLHCSYINTFLSTNLLASILCFIVCKFSHMYFGFTHSFIHLLTRYILIKVLLRPMHCAQRRYKKTDVCPLLGLKTWGETRNKKLNIIFTNQVCNLLLSDHREGKQSNQISLV